MKEIFFVFGYFLMTDFRPVDGKPASMASSLPLHRIDWLIFCWNWNVHVSTALPPDDMVGSVLSTSTKNLWFKYICKTNVFLFLLVRVNDGAVHHVPSKSGPLIKAMRKSQDVHGTCHESWIKCQEPVPHMSRLEFSEMDKAI